MEPLLFPFLLLNIWTANSLALTIQNCPLVVQENTVNFTISCQGIRSNEKVNWRHKIRNLDNDVGTCDPPPAQCESKLTNFMILSRPSHIESRMTVRNATRDLYSTADITCLTQLGTTPADSVTCQMEVIYAADVTSCSIQPIRKEGSWFVEGECVISKVFSSRDRYSCDLRERREDSTETSANKTNYSPIEDNGTPTYAHGTCDYSASLPTTLGNYQYIVVVEPGGRRILAGNIEVALPQTPPSINCTSGSNRFVKENSDLDCTCTASDMGQPPGRLLGYHGNDLVELGDYGNATLTFPRKKIDRKDDGTNVRCVLRTDIPGQEGRDKTAIYVISVAYAAEVSSLKLNDSKATTVNESWTDLLQLSCLSRGFPTPTIRLYKNGSDETRILADGVATSLSYTATPVCENSGMYGCFAENAIGVSSAHTVTLTVWCLPRLLVRNNKPDFGVVKYEGNATTLTFDIVTFPAPTHLTILYLGHEGVGNEQPVRGDSVSIICSLGATSWNHTCVVTVDAMTQDDEGFYRAVVANPLGQATYTFYVVVKKENSSSGAEVTSLTLNGVSRSLTIIESLAEYVTLSCITSGNPTPSMIITKEEELSTNHTLAEGTSERLRSKISARCENTGNYNCVAQNSVGESQETIELKILCPPRIKFNETNIPTLNFSGVPVALTFDIVTFPAPNVTRVTYLGSDLINKNELPLSHERVNVNCTGTSVSWRAHCAVNVNNVTRKDEGFYRVLVANTQGQTSFTFIAVIAGGDHEDSNSDALEGTTGLNTEARNVAVALGILLAVFAIATVVLLIVVIRMWRGQSMPKTDAKTIGKSDKESYVQGEGNYAEIPLTSIYSVSAGGPAPRLPHRAATDVRYTPVGQRRQLRDRVGNSEVPARSTWLESAQRDNLAEEKENAKAWQQTIPFSTVFPARGTVDAAGYLLPKEKQPRTNAPALYPYITPVPPEPDSKPCKLSLPPPPDLDNVPAPCSPTGYIPMTKYATSETAVSFQRARPVEEQESGTQV